MFQWYSCTYINLHVTPPFLLVWLKDKNITIFPCLEYVEDISVMVLLPKISTFNYLIDNEVELCHTSFLLHSL